MVLSALLQVGGLALVVRSLAKAWHSRSFRAKLGDALLGRESPREGASVRLEPAIFDGFGVGLTPLEADATAEQRAAYYERKALDAFVAAHTALAQLRVMDARVTRLHERLGEQVQDVESRLQEWIRNEEARQVPLALWGVMLTFAGMVLQTAVDLRSAFS